MSSCKLDVKSLAQGHMTHMRPQRLGIDLETGLISSYFLKAVWGVTIYMVEGQFSDLCKRGEERVGAREGVIVPGWVCEGIQNLWQEVTEEVELGFWVVVY